MDNTTDSMYMKQCLFPLRGWVRGTYKKGPGIMFITFPSLPLPIRAWRKNVIFMDERGRWGEERLIMMFIPGKRGISG